jgi:MFS transporter, PAT family, beta-lactamase induction signal transducer AmpG
MATATATSQEATPPKGWRLLGAAFTSKKTALMVAFGFSAGLPQALLVGSLTAWLGKWEINLATIGLISWIGLAYAFKFLWSPLVDRVALPGLDRLGRRRSWLLLCQLVLVAAIFALALIDPRASIGLFALVAFIGAFASATQDIVVDAWRIDIADERATVEVLSSVYQLGYRTASLVGGALALYLSGIYDWPTVFMIMGGFMALAIIATLVAPDTPRPDREADDIAFRSPGAIDPKWRAIGLGVVALAWGWSIWVIGSFMVQSLTVAEGEKAPSAIEFTRYTGPWIIVATILVPALVAALFNYWRKTNRNVVTQELPKRTGSARAADHAYHALITPLSELIRRLGWGVIIVLLLILSYRITDSVWGAFANPFYLSELKYSEEEVAFASKIFGVLMTMAGIALGALLFVLIGRMPTLLIGAIVSAVSNLLYADLAVGSPGIDVFASTFGLDQLGADMRMVRLMIAISGENIAGGLAGAAYVGYLSSITSREFSAVQYALLSSLTLLVGALGRAPLGQAIEEMGYAPVFRFTALIGMIAVVVVIVEWIRGSSAERRRRGSAQLKTADDFKAAQGDGP